VGGGAGGGGAELALGETEEALPDLLALGTNYDTCQQLTWGGKPIVLSAKGKWACVVSRRQFGTEEAVRSHIQLSQLYKDCLQKAIEKGQIQLRR
jgi:hypothetical protein